MVSSGGGPVNPGATWVENTSVGESGVGCNALNHDRPGAAIAWGRHRELEVGPLELVESPGAAGDLGRALFELRLALQTDGWAFAVACVRVGSGCGSPAATGSSA